MKQISDIINIARSLIKSENLIEAEVTLLEALDFFDRSPVIRIMLADIYIKTGKLNEAEKFVNDSIALNPSNIYALQKRGDIMAIKKMYPEALEIFLDLYRNNKNDYFLIKRIAKTYYLLRNFSKALEYINIAIKNFPEKDDLFFLKYQVCFDMKEIKGAEESIKRACDLNPRNKLYYSKKLSLRVREKELNSENIKEILQFTNEEDSYLLKLYADKLKEEGNIDKSIEVYKKLIYINNNEYNKKSLAFVYYKIKDYRNAFKIFITLSDINYLDHIFLSSIIKSAQDIDDKRELLDKLIQLTKKDNSYKKLWGKIKKIEKELKDYENQ